MPKRYRRSKIRKSRRYGRLKKRYRYRAKKFSKRVKRVMMKTLEPKNFHSTTEGGV